MAKNRNKSNSPAATATVAGLRPAADVVKDIQAVAATATAIGGTIHNLAVECLEHAKEHGNATLLQTLYLELPRSQRREAVLAWAIRFSPVRVTQKGAKCGILPKDAKNYVEFDIEAAKLNPYYELDERNGFKAAPFNLMQILTKAYKKAYEAKTRHDQGVFEYPDGYDADREIAQIEAAAESLNLTLATPDMAKVIEDCDAIKARTEALAA